MSDCQSVMTTLTDNGLCIPRTRLSANLGGAACESNHRVEQIFDVAPCRIVLRHPWHGYDMPFRLGIDRIGAFQVHQFPIQLPDGCF
jgi:hypothetical protein